ncbi:MAG: Yip1 family protein [Bacteroidales bacterium]|nr:Yip1 family protein [Bacteroidales bacterium]MDD3521464.1 Yip1 family protein [Bacteroidales bacterium]MDD4030807.1 Yip1 family protein [Bacteroidales bacterium]
MATKKKVTRVGGDEVTPQPGQEPKPFVPTPESKSKATRLRVFAGILWVLAIAAQVVAISMLFKQPINMTWIIILIGIDLALAIVGSLLWKKSNRFDPASEKNKFLFFMQSQLGLVVAVIAFLPLVIFILTSKNLDKKQKGLLGGIAAGALVIAGLVGVDYNPPSAEEYAEQTARVEELTGANLVYWTKSGTKYHIYDDCHAINRDATTEIFQGSVAQARELKNITELCKFCETRAEKAKELPAAVESGIEGLEEIGEQVKEKVEELVE